MHQDSFAFRIEKLRKEHDRHGFDCGEPSLNHYLLRQAGQDQKRDVSACFVLVKKFSGEIAGYYTLSAGAVLLPDLPEDAIKSLPRYPQIPVLLIGRLASDLRFRRQGLGEHLLMDALYRAYLTADREIGAWAVIVDALNDKATAFYRRYGFRSFPLQQQRMFLPMQQVRQMFMPGAEYFTPPPRNSPAHRARRRVAASRSSFWRGARR